MAKSYMDLAMRRQVILERLKSGEVVNYTREIKNIERIVKDTLLGLDEELGELSRTRLNKLLVELRADISDVFQVASTAHVESLSTISAVYARQELLDLKATVDLRGTKLNAFTKKELYSKVIQTPLSTDGGLLEPWIKDLGTRETKRISDIVRKGHSEGVTNQDMVRQIVGTKSNNFKDGVLQTTRRNASTMVRTSTQHVASAARQEVWEANQDVVSHYEWVSTLDGKTSAVCRSLDGQEFEFGKGPIPPIHPNCRSTTVPVLNEKYRYLSNGRTRSTATGPKDEQLDYYDWLKEQGEKTQQDVLGKKRAQLFRDGGMSAERFRKLQFDKHFEPLTLDEMRKMEPAGV